MSNESFKPTQKELTIRITNRGLIPYATQKERRNIKNQISTWDLEATEDDVDRILLKERPETPTLEDSFLLACWQGDLDNVKEILKTNQVDISNNNDLGLRFAAKNIHADVVQYLISSPELTQHANIHVNNDEVFKTCKHGRDEDIMFLVFDFNIEKTLTIEEYIKNKPDIEKLFKLRDVSKSVNNFKLKPKM